MPCECIVIQYSSMQQSPTTQPFTRWLSVSQPSTSHHENFHEYFLPIKCSSLQLFQHLFLSPPFSGAFFPPPTQSLMLDRKRRAIYKGVSLEGRTTKQACTNDVLQLCLSAGGKCKVTTSARAGGSRRVIQSEYYFCYLEHEVRSFWL